MKENYSILIDIVIIISIMSVILVICCMLLIGEIMNGVFMVEWFGISIKIGIECLILERILLKFGRVFFIKFLILFFISICIVCLNLLDCK